MQVYLTTDEAAVYLGIKERKLYELVANGAIPCSKVTGKWLFPRAALDRWVEAGLVRPAGFQPGEPPPIVGGSHDLLLEWTVRRSGSGLALLPEGSENGLARLDRNEVVIAAIHCHSSEDDAAANRAAVLSAISLHDAVVIGFARREQGLITAPGNPLRLGGLEDAHRLQARFGLRQHGAGAQLLLEALLSRQNHAVGELVRVGEPYGTGQDLALAIRAGDIDCGVANRSIATSNGLGFVPLVWEDFDLVMRRRSYFEPPVQALIHCLRQPEFHRQAEQFGGYDTQVAGQVRLNR